MAYPEAIPPLKGKAAKKFEEDLKNFSLTNKQKKFYKEAQKLFGKKCPKDCIGHWKIGYCVGCIRYPNQKDKYSKDKCRCDICEPGA